MEKIPIKNDEEEDEEIFWSPRKEEEEQIGVISIISDVEEKNKICNLREMVQKIDPACKEVDDRTLRRFLRARDLNVDKASEMFVKYLAWRRKCGSIQASEVRNHLAHNKDFLQGTDKTGCPISVILGAKHFPCKQGMDEFKRFVVFALDKICSRIPNGEEKFTIIADLKGYGYSNSDVRGNIVSLSILQDYYPERLRKLFIVHAPYIFMTAWKIIYPFIDKKTKKKIVFVENKKVRQALLEEIEENQLPEMYGGKLQLVPIQDG